MSAKTNRAGVVIEVARVVVTRGEMTGTGDTVTEVVEEEEEATKEMIVTVIETTEIVEVRTEVAGGTTAATEVTSTEVTSTITAEALVVTAAVEMLATTRARAPVMVGGSEVAEDHHTRAGMGITMVVVVGGDERRIKRIFIICEQ